MNASPHVHDIGITHDAYWWYITYGDQKKTVGKPYFRNPVKVLDNAVRKLIAQHDNESREAGKVEEQYKQTMATVLGHFKYTPAVQGRDSFGLLVNYEPEHYTLPEPDKWGSEQLTHA